MKIVQSVALAFVLTGLTAGVTSASAQEHKLVRSQLPTVVAAAVDKNTAGSTIKGFATEREHGKTVYEVETLVAGRSRDLQIAEDGTVNEIEEEVAFAALPTPVRQSLNTASKGGTINKVESLTKAGKLVAYEAVVQKGSSRHEVQVGPRGEKLVHEE